MRTHVTFCSSDCQSLSYKRFEGEAHPCTFAGVTSGAHTLGGTECYRITAVFKVMIHVSDPRDAEAQAGIL